MSANPPLGGHPAAHFQQFFIHGVLSDGEKCFSESWLKGIGGDPKNALSWRSDAGYLWGAATDPLAFANPGAGVATATSKEIFQQEIARLTHEISSRFVKGGPPILLHGHSAGGVMGAALSEALRKQGIPVAGLITYGTPMESVREFDVDVPRDIPVLALRSEGDLIGGGSVIDNFGKHLLSALGVSSTDKFSDRPLLERHVVDGATWESHTFDQNFARNRDAAEYVNRFTSKLSQGIDHTAGSAASGSGETEAHMSQGGSVGQSAHGAAIDAQRSAEHAAHFESDAHAQAQQLAVEVTEIHAYAQQASVHVADAHTHAQQAGAHQADAQQYAQQAGAHTNEAQEFAQQAASHAAEALTQSQQAGMHAGEAETHMMRAAIHDADAQTHAQQSATHSADALMHAQHAGQQETVAETHAHHAAQHQTDSQHAASQAQSHEVEAGQALQATQLHQHEAGRLHQEVAQLRADSDSLHRAIEDLRAHAEQLLHQIAESAGRAQQHATEAAHHASEAASSAAAAASAAARANDFAG